MVGQPPPPGRLRRVDLKSAQCLGYGTLATCQSFASMAREVVESALRCSAQPPEKKEEFERGVPLRVRVILDADSLRVRVDLEGFGAEADALLGDEGLRALTKFATVSVVTRAGGSLDTTEVLWKGGDLVGSGRSSTCRHSYGSTIILKDVLTNLPVRRRILLGARRERHLAQLRRHMFPAMASNGRVSFDFFCAGKAGRAFGSAPGAGVQRILVDTFGLDPKALAQVSCEARGAAATLCYARDWRNQHQVLFEHLFVNGREADCRAVAGEVKLVASGLFREQGLGTIRDRRRRACFSFVLSVTCARDVRQSEALERVLQRVLASFQSAESEARREEETQKWKSSRAMIPKAGACECCAGGGREAVRLRVDAAFRAGRTGIGVGDIKSLSYLETSIVPASITRGMLDRALCLGQVDNKFVASVCGSTLVLFDQHAADERVRLERFTEILTEDLGSRDRDSSSSVECGPPLGLGRMCCRRSRHGTRPSPPPPPRDRTSARGRRQGPCHHRHVDGDGAEESPGFRDGRRHVFLRSATRHPRLGPLPIPQSPSSRVLLLPSRPLRRARPLRQNFVVDSKFAVDKSWQIMANLWRWPAPGVYRSGETERGPHNRDEHVAHPRQQSNKANKTYTSKPPANNNMRTTLSIVLACLAATAASATSPPHPHLPHPEWKPASVNVYGFGGSEASLHGAGDAKGRSEDIATAFANGIVSGINTLDRSSSHAVYGAGGNAKSEGGGQSSAHAENWKGAVSGTSGSVSKSASDSHDHYHAYKPYVHAMADGHYGAEGYGPMVASQGGQHSDSEASGAQAGSSNVAGTRSYQGPSPEALRRVSMGVQHATSEGLGFLTWLKPGYGFD